MLAKQWEKHQQLAGLSLTAQRDKRQQGRFMVGLTPDQTRLPTSQRSYAHLDHVLGLGKGPVGALRTRLLLFSSGAKPDDLPNCSNV